MSDLVPHLIIAATTIYLLAFVVAAPVPQVLTRIPDDASYYFEIGENIARGEGPTFDGLHSTNGFQPLWAVVIAAIYTVVRSSPEIMVRVYLVIQIVLLVGAWLMFQPTLRRLFAPRVVALGTVVFAYFVFIRAVNGMESALMVFLVALLFRYSWKADIFGQPSDARLFITGILLGLVLVARLDLVFFAGVYHLVLLGRLWRGGTSPRRAFVRVAVMAGGVVLVVAPTVVFNLQLFGHPVPISGQLKSSFPHPAISDSTLRIISNFYRLFLAVAPVYVLFAWLRSRSARLLAPELRCFRFFFAILAVGTMIHALYSLLFVKWALFSWHFLPLSLFFALAIFDPVAEALDHLRGPIWRGLIWAGCGLLFVVAGVKTHEAAFGLDYERNWRSQDYAAAVWARQYTRPDEVFAMKDAGIFGYFSQRSVINLDGLVNNLAYQEVLRERRLAKYFASEAVGYLVVHCMLEDGDRNVRQQVHGRMGSVKDGQYQKLSFEFLSQKHDTYSDPIRVCRSDEVFHDKSPGGGNVFVIFRYRPEGCSN